MGVKHRTRPSGVHLLAVLSLTAIAGCGNPDPNVGTQHNDNFRTGAYLAETTLTPAAVRNRGMHVKYWLGPCNRQARDPHGDAQMTGCIDGTIVTQPLYVNRVRFDLPFVEVQAPGIYVATTSNKVYGIEAELGLILWTTDLMVGHPGFSKWVSSTPVIDVPANRLYVVYAIKNQIEDLPFCDQRNSDDPARRSAARTQSARLVVQYRLAQLDLSTGNVLRDQEITAEARTEKGERVEFIPKFQVNHPALLLHRGSIYVAFGSPAWSEGCVWYHGWVMQYDANDLRQQASFNTSPDWPGPGNAAGVWQGGGGLAADDQSVYFLTGDGRADTSTEIVSARPDFYARRRRFYGDSIVKLRPSRGSFQVWSYAPPGADDLSAHDADLGSGGALIVPNSDIVLGGGKSGLMYLLKRSSMTEQEIFDATTNKYNDKLRGETWDKGPHLHGSPTYWASSDSSHGFLYVWGEKDILRQYQFNKSTQQIDPKIGSRLGTIRAEWDVMPGGMLSLSADGTRQGSAVLWGTLPLSPPPAPYQGALYAFDAESLDFLWNTRYGTVAHWVPPTIAAGKVILAEGDPFKAGSEALTVFELGRNDGSDRSRGGPIQPAPPQTCKFCHASDDRLTKRTDMSAHFKTGGEAQMRPGLTLAALSPREGAELAVVLHGMGTQTYAAQLDPNARERLMWSLTDRTADLTDAPSGGDTYAPAAANANANVTPSAQAPPTAASQANARTLRVTLARDTWTAADGSSVVAAVDRRTSSPEGMDADWVLFRALRNSGRGALHDVTYIQQVYTHAGHAPTDPPKRAGETVKVPYVAEYWLYR